LTQYHYVILPRLEVAGANAQPVTWLLGPPPITAYQGFVHALALFLGVKSHAGFALIHHDVEQLGDTISGVLHPFQQRGAQLVDHRDYASATPHLLSSQPSARCRVTVSLIVRFDAESALAEHKIERFLRGARIAGGSVVAHGFSARDASLIRPRAHYSADIALRLGTGFAVRERPDLLTMRTGDKDIIAPFLRAITRSFEPSDSIAAGADDARNWIMPTTVGYAQISRQESRDQVRQGLKHAFAEPLLALVEYVPLRRTQPLFWTPRWPAPGVYVVSTTPGDTPRLEKGLE
jgi:CRISPR-associated protein Csy2